MHRTRRNQAGVWLLMGGLLLWPSSSGAQTPTAKPQPAPTEQKPAPPRATEDTIVDALAEAIPLGKEVIRSIAKPILDTVVITPAEEIQIGNTFFRELKRKLGPKLDANRTDVNYVNVIGQALAKNTRRKGIPYHFHVVEEDTINAFAIPGGHVFVYRGLLDQIVDNEAQLAAVLGHEISHVDAEHTIDFFKPVKAASQFPLADVAVMVATLGSKILSFSYSEVQESEADDLGTRLAFKLNYEPLQGAVAHRKLAALKMSDKTDPITGLTNALLRSHPPSERRAVAIEAEAKELHQQEPTRKAYVGALNFKRRVPLSVRVFE